MAGDQSSKGSAPHPTSPSGVEDLNYNLIAPSSGDINFDPQTIKQIAGILSMEDMLPEVKQEPTELFSSCSGGQSSFAVELNPNMKFSLKVEDSVHHESMDCGIDSPPSVSSVNTELSTLNWSVPTKDKRKTQNKKLKMAGVDKKERRKAQNRQAAKNYREKQKQRKEKVEADFTHLITERSSIEKEVLDLKKQLAELQKILEDHEKQGNCRLTSPHNVINTSAVVDGSPYSMVGVPSTPSAVVDGSPYSMVGVPSTPQFCTDTEVRQSTIPRPPSADQVATLPITPLSNQSFNYDNNLYSPTPPGNDVSDKLGCARRVLSPLPAMSPECHQLQTFNNNNNVMSIGGEYLDSSMALLNVGGGDYLDNPLSQSITMDPSLASSFDTFSDLNNFQMFL